jgi:peptidoglycan-associated lipoprotein
MIGLIFACAFVFLLASCETTKKKTVPSKGVSTATKGKKGETPEERARRLEREAKLRELEEAKRLKEKFEADSIYFGFNESFLTSEARVKLKKKAAWLRKNPAYSVQISGHCDERGTNEYNLVLGEKRAHAAKKHLVLLGVSAKRISTISYGEEKPADPRHTEEAWAKNRRCEFTLKK